MPLSFFFLIDWLLLYALVAVVSLDIKHFVIYAIFTILLMILFRYIFLLNINFFIIIFRFIDDKESVSNCSSCFTLMSWLDLFISHHLFRKHGQMTKLCSDYYFSWANTWILFNIFIWNMKVFVEYMWSYQRFYQGFFFFFFFL